MRTILLAILFLSAGCGNKSDHPRVRIAVVGPGLQTYSMPIILAHSLGYFTEAGLDVALEFLPSSPRTLQALIGGSVDAAGVSYSQVVQVAAEGQRICAFFIGVRRDSRVLIVSPAATSKFRRVEDLNGEVIGVSSPGSSTHQWVNYVLARHGIHPSDVSVVGIGVAAAAAAAIESGRVGAASLAGGEHFYLLKRHPDLRILVDASTPEGMGETFGSDAFANGTLSAKQSWLDRNPDTARRLARALQSTLKWIAAHTPEEIRERLPEALHSPDAAVDVDIIRWGRLQYSADGKMPVGAPEAVKHFLDATVPEVRDSKIDLAATWTNQFLPGSK